MLKSVLFAILALGAAIAAPRNAHAMPPVEGVDLAADRGASGSELPTKSVEVWYGWQTLLIDSAALGAGALAFASGEDAGIAPSLPAYALGAPVVHLIHERPAAALLSGISRIALPLGLGFALGGAPECGHERTCYSDAFMAGAALGAAASVAIDAAWLSWQPAERAPRSYMVPAVLVGNGTYGLAISGSL